MANTAAINTKWHGGVNNETHIRNTSSFCWCKSPSNNSHYQLFTD